MRNISLILSAVAFILGIIAICVSAYRSPELSIDYQGIIVASLSLIVTVLLGWQIYQVICVDKLVKSKMDEALLKYDKEMNELIANNEIDRLNDLMALAFSSDDYGLVFYYATHIPKQILRIEDIDEDYLNKKVIARLEDALLALQDNPNMLLAPNALPRLINAYRPLAHFAAVYEFLILCERVRKSVETQEKG